MSNPDLELIGRKFATNNLPSERLFLIKYFQSELSKAFAFYYFSFKELAEINPNRFCVNFIDHTGYYCSRQRVQFLLKKMKVLLQATEQAEQTLNLLLLEKIKTGKFRPNQSHW